ncbi:hypothetical protein J6590_017332 [Homalodisca vitripennis]|nr:hypothetical protein J6590_017332 [Homalodisca vitripennis]
METIVIGDQQARGSHALGGHGRTEGVKANAAIQHCYVWTDGGALQEFKALPSPPTSYTIERTCGYMLTLVERGLCSRTFMPPRPISIGDARDRCCQSPGDDVFVDVHARKYNHFCVARDRCYQSPCDDVFVDVHARKYNHFCVARDRCYQSSVGGHSCHKEQSPLALLETAVINRLLVICWWTFMPQRTIAIGVA